MPRELYVPIIITMANFKEALSDAQYCTLTLEAEEAKIVQTICQKRDEKNNQKDSWDKFFSSSSFPANPTINNIIAHAFSTGNFTKSILRDLKYINDNDELEASAPRLFKKLYTDYMSNKDCKVNNTYVFGSWF